MIANFNSWSDINPSHTHFRQRAHWFKIEVAYHGPRRKPDVSYAYHATVADLARAGDLLVVSFPGGPQTEGLVDRSVIEA